MSAEIITMPLSADKAWEVYSALVAERRANHALLGDRSHVEACILARDAFDRALAREDRRLP